MCYTFVTAHSATLTFLANVIGRSLNNMHITISDHMRLLICFPLKKKYILLWTELHYEQNKYDIDHKRFLLRWFMLRSNATRPLSYDPKQPLRNQMPDAHLGWCAWVPGPHHSSLLHI